VIYLVSPAAHSPMGENGGEIHEEVFNSRRSKTATLILTLVLNILLRVLN